MGLAYRAYERKLFGASAKLYTEALDIDPKLADDRQSQHRYNAACAAAQAVAAKSGGALPSEKEDEFGGGGKEEVKFVRLAVDLLVPGGILVLVCPVNQVFGRHEMCTLLDTWFDHATTRSGWS